LAFTDTARSSHSSIIPKSLTQVTGNTCPMCSSGFSASWLRRGEGWALWAAAIPLVVLGFPIFIVDAIFVPAQRRFATLLPQGIGDLFALAVLGYLFWQKYSRPPNVLDR